MKRLLFVAIALVLCTALAATREPIYDYFLYLPMVAGGGPTSTPTPRPTLAPPTLTPTVRPTLTP